MLYSFLHSFIEQTRFAIQSHTSGTKHWLRCSFFEHGRQLYFFVSSLKKMKVEPERLLTHRTQKKCKPNQKCRMINCISNYNKSLIHFHLNWIFFLRCSLMLCSLFASFLLFLSHSSSLLSQQNTGLFCKFYEYIYNIDNEMMNLDGNCGFYIINDFWLQKCRISSQKCAKKDVY